jgi:hypothetical protein
MDEKLTAYFLLFVSTYVVIISLFLSITYLIEFNLSLFILCTFMVFFGMMLFIYFKQEITVIDRDIEKQIKIAKKNDQLLLYPDKLVNPTTYSDL